jgi:hypothetical protein
MEQPYGYSCCECRTQVNAETEAAAELAVVKAGWIIGTDVSGQGQYACPDCGPNLHFVLGPMRL